MMTDSRRVPGQRKVLLRWLLVLLALVVAASAACAMGHGGRRHMGPGRGGMMGPGSGMGMGPGMMGPGPDLGSSPVPLDAETLALGRQVFQTHCQVCHGEGGQGDGPGAAGLNPKPRDLTQPFAGRSLGTVAGAVTEGLGAMPGYEAVLSQREIWSVAQYVLQLRR